MGEGMSLDFVKIETAGGGEVSFRRNPDGTVSVTVHDGIEGGCEGVPAEELRRALELVLPAKSE